MAVVDVGAVERDDVVHLLLDRLLARHGAERLEYVRTVSTCLVLRTFMKAVRSGTSTHSVMAVRSPSSVTGVMERVELHLGGRLTERLGSERADHLAGLHFGSRFLSASQTPTR